MTKVTYLHHSGFMVETEKNCLVFDYYTDGGKFDNIDLSAFNGKNVFVFVSHFHQDHYDRNVIFKWKDMNVRYILSKDCMYDKSLENVTVVNANKGYIIDGVAIETLKSTDEGVAYIVHSDGITIYHAGDLNWWHWEGEEEEFNLDQAKRYQQQMQLLADALDGNHLDLACIPVDPRLHSDCLRGLLAFDSRVFAKNILPIHFWGDFSVMQTLHDRLSPELFSRILTVEHPGKVCSNL